MYTKAIMVYYAGSETLTYAILGGGVGLIVLFCIVQHNSAWFRNCCRYIGCDCCISNSVAPEIFTRTPTSAEYIYAMAELLQSPSTTRLPEIIADMVKGPVRTGSIPLPPVEPPYKNRNDTIMEILE